MYVEQQMFGLEDDYLLMNLMSVWDIYYCWKSNVLAALDKYDERNQLVNCKSRISVYLHNVKRNFFFFSIYSQRSALGTDMETLSFCMEKDKRIFLIEKNNHDL